MPPLDWGGAPLRGTLGSSLRSPAEGEGHEGFPPPPEEDLVFGIAFLWNWNEN